MRKIEDELKKSTGVVQTITIIPYYFSNKYFILLYLNKPFDIKN